mmetsp:Transcript_12301/g.18865  ORF Transcript_12301/g.18865 Transcript_12301/m.18865 type:complete len:362 (+) Transcript_12301:143-1228(+)
MVCCKCCQGCALVCRVVTNFWLLAGIVMSSVALFSCQFAEQRRTGQGLGLIFSEQLNGETGSYQCVESVSENSGWIYSWAFVCGCLAPIFGIAVFILMLFDCCCKVCCSKVMQGFLFFAAIFCQGCTLLVYVSSPCYFDGNGFTCKMGYGTVWTIIAFWAYLIASLFLCCSPKHDPATCCYDDDDAKPAAKEQYDEEQPAPAEQNAAEATVVAAAVVQEEKKQPEEAEAKVEESQAVEEKEVAEETPVAAAAAVEEETVEEPSVAASEKEEAVEETSAAKEEEADEEPEEEPVQEEVEVNLEDDVKVSVKEDGISTRLEPSVTGTGPDPDDSVGGEDPDGDKFLGESISIKPNLSMKTTPW